MPDVVVLTGSELRHDFMRRAIGLDEEINVLRSYCEGLEGTALSRARESGSEIRIRHLEQRGRAERDFFKHFVELTADESGPQEIPRGDINDRRYFEEIQSLDPDLLVAYGCSIITDPLLSAFDDRFLNVHLGLSPYYRGTGTNFWPLVNGEPEYVGATFMHMDEGVDTGQIIHQQRADVHPGDTPHRIGNRLIASIPSTYREIIRKFESLPSSPKPPEPDQARYYEKDDYSEEATRRLYEQFEDGLIEEYLEEQEDRIAAVPIVKNPGLSAES